MPVRSVLPAALRPYVVSLSMYDVAVGAGKTHRGLPSTSLSVMVPLDDPVDIGWQDAPGSYRSHRAVLSGLHSSPALMRYRGRRPRGMWLTLSPLGSRALLGLPASALAHRITDLGTVCPGLRDLPEQLAAARSGPACVQVAATALLVCLTANDGMATPGPAARALRAVAATSRVQDAADRIGYSRRQLGNLLRAEFGVTPKEFQRIARFQRSRQRLSAGLRGTGAVVIADAAAESGYADHAHLTREWRALAGCTPSEWLHAETVFIRKPEAGDFPDVQDTGVPATAGW